MRSDLFEKRVIAVVAATCLLATALHAQNKKVTINWNKTISISNTIPTLQVVYNPMLREGSPMHKNTFEALKNIKADYVRYVPWYPYPKAAVVELKEPTKDRTFWDFTYADPTMKDLFDAQQGRSVIINFSTIPVWMFKLNKPAFVDDNPDALNWPYNQGKELRDPSGREVAAYFCRILSWYTRGGFTDELGKFHKSGLFYKIPYWEVLNEPDLEHNLTPEVYTRLYDNIVVEMRKIQPDLKFVGISAAFENDPERFEYFLNPSNHKSGIPLDAISYHFYGHPTSIDQDIDSYQFSFFDQANGFLDKVRYIESIRKRLAPQTKTQINEIGDILKDSNYQGVIPDSYWNLAGAMYAYLYLELTKIGINVVGESQLVGYPTQFPDVSMMDYKNNQPNARYWTLKLLKENFGPGDKLQATSTTEPEVAAQAFMTTKGRKLLLINKRNKDIQLDLPADARAAKVSYVDITTGDNPVGTKQLENNTIMLKAYSVAVVSLD